MGHLHTRSSKSRRFIYYFAIRSISLAQRPSELGNAKPHHGCATEMDTRDARARTTGTTGTTTTSNGRSNHSQAARLPLACRRCNFEQSHSNCCCSYPRSCFYPSNAPVSPASIPRPGSLLPPPLSLASCCPSPRHWPRSYQCSHSHAAQVRIPAPLLICPSAPPRPELLLPQELPTTLLNLISQHGGYQD